MLPLNNVAVADGYSDAATLGPVVNCKFITFVLANNSAVMQINPVGVPVPDWGPEILITASQGNTISLASGVRFRNAVPGSVARVSGYLAQPNDPIFTGGPLFAGTLTGGGSVTPPGGGFVELAYAQITAPVAVSATTEATATPIVTAPSINGDGSTPIAIEFFAPYSAQNTTAQEMYLVLYDTGATIGILVHARFPYVGPPFYASQRLIPSVGAHVFSIRAFVAGSGGSPAINAGPGGAGQLLPAYIRITN